MALMSVARIRCSVVRCDVKVGPGSFTPRLSNSALSTLSHSRCFPPLRRYFCGLWSRFYVVPSLSLVPFLSSPFLVLLPPVCAPLNRVNDRERVARDVGRKVRHFCNHPLIRSMQCLIMQIFANKNLQVSLVQFTRNGLYVRPGRRARRK